MTNRFNFLLSEALVAEGCEVTELQGDANQDRTLPDPLRLCGRWEVFHIHWPQKVVQGRWHRAVINLALLVSRIAVQRLKGARIVWTVHNARDHDANHPILERVLMAVVVRLLHGLIFLTASSRAAAIEEMPTLASKPYAVIPHGLYGDRSSKTTEEARTAFELPQDHRVIGFLGDIRRYKGLDRLVEAFAETSPGQITLFVAGAFQDPDYAADMRASLSRLKAGGHSVIFREERLSDGALTDAIRACDVVALPYRAVWNSGLALLVLENAGRILASDAPFFHELRDEVGPGRVRINAELSGEDIVAAVAGPAPEYEGLRVAFLQARMWPRIGAETVAFYRRLGACRLS